MAKTNRSRRKFFGTLILFLAGLFPLGKFLIPRVQPKKVLLSVAKSELPVQGALVYKEARVAIIREKDVVYALNLVCTHLGCTLNVTPTLLVCPCHGSNFDRQGRVLKGPADRHLLRYQVEDRGDFFEVVV
ncbi:MAG: ubiquinol-cytochrome c reductase iron-sulfur subunit [Geobacteraceae bacterium]|jgi:cytochrome b6-f complex iron-sulfur subunit